jgi:hypothetical protein
MNQEKRPHEEILDKYRAMVSKRHAALEKSWPVLSGYNVSYAGAGDWLVVIFKATSNRSLVETSGLGELPPSVVGPNALSVAEIDGLKSRLRKFLRLGASDAVVVMDPNGRVQVSDFEQMMSAHEAEMGLAPMKIFLSHKGVDKPYVREIKSTLLLLGFDPWLDEDALTAGADLERGLLQGFKDSCAAIFFVTPNFADEGYLSTEVGYAVREKRAKDERFQIITLVLGDTGNAKVPDLLKPFVWKNPKSQFQALQEIIKALPVKVGHVTWKQ